MSHSGDCCVLTVNAGSSSLKAAIYDLDGEERVLSRVEAQRPGHPDASLSVFDGETLLREVHEGVEDHAAALRIALTALGQLDRLPDLYAIGHRVVHGGPSYSAPA